MKCRYFQLCHNESEAPGLPCNACRKRLMKVEAAIKQGKQPKEQLDLF